MAQKIATTTTRFEPRRQLGEAYAAILVERPELGSLVGARQREAPVYRWVAYKESFSPALVREVLSHVGTPGRLLDPFCGTGTSLLVGAERNMEVQGVELLPYAAFVARTCLEAHRTTPDQLREACSFVLSRRISHRGRFPDLPAGEWAFSSEVLTALYRLQLGVEQVDDPRVADLCRLALLGLVEPMSFAVRDGTSLRHRQPGSRTGRAGVRRSADDVRLAFADRMQQIANDVVHAPRARRARVIEGDARSVPFGAADIAIFSPPYPNRYDYSATYQLELGFGFCADNCQLRALRRSLLRSHLESPWPERRTLAVPALDEFLLAMLSQRDQGDESMRVARMVCGFFEDMAVVLRRLVSSLALGAQLAIVVGTQTFNGENLPTDLLLAQLAEHAGMVCKEIWVARTKGVASQQRGIRSRLANRESILLLSNRT